MWNICAETVGYLGSVVMVSLETSWSVVFGTMQMIIWPFWFVFSTAVTIGIVALTSQVIYFIFLQVLILISCYFCFLVASKCSSVPCNLAPWRDTSCTFPTSAWAVKFCCGPFC